MILTCSDDEIAVALVSAAGLQAPPFATGLPAQHSGHSWPLWQIHHTGTAAPGLAPLLVAERCRAHAVWGCRGGCCVVPLYGGSFAELSSTDFVATLADRGYFGLVPGGDRRAVALQVWLSTAVRSEPPPCGPSARGRRSVGDGAASAARGGLRFRLLSAVVDIASP